MFGNGFDAGVAVGVIVMGTVRGMHRMARSMADISARKLSE